MISHRLRYPLRAKLAIAGVASFFLAELAFTALWLMPLLPLVPLFILVQLGNGLILADVLSWATSLARSEPLKVPGAETTRAEKARAAERRREAEAAPAT
jgi:hypothetical protein